MRRKEKGGGRRKEEEGRRKRRKDSFWFSGRGLYLYCIEYLYESKRQERKKNRDLEHARSWKRVGHKMDAANRR